MANFSNVKSEMKTLEQINHDYQTIMNGYQQPQDFGNNGQINPHVYFEQFSVYDKSLQSTSTASIIC